MRSMAWQCIAEGARGLIFFSWFDIKRDTVVPFDVQWGYVKQMAAEVRDLSDVLLSVEKPPTIGTEPVQWLHWTTRQAGRVTYLIAVNAENDRQRATFGLGRTPKRVRLRGSAAPVTMQGAQLQAELDPFGVNVYEVEFR
jgi:hypothetical protein